METNKERIENLEIELEELQEKWKWHNWKIVPYKRNHQQVVWGVAY